MRNEVNDTKSRATNRKFGERGTFSPEMRRESRDLLLDKTIGVLGSLYPPEFFRWVDSSSIRASKITRAEAEINRAFESGSEGDFESACERFLELHKTMHQEWQKNK